MDESGDGWLCESASKRAGVAQSPDGRRAITIFDPPRKEPCRDPHTVRARHPEGSAVSLTRAGPHTSTSHTTYRHPGGHSNQIQTPKGEPPKGPRPGFRPKRLPIRSAIQGFRPTKIPGGAVSSHPPGYQIGGQSNALHPGVSGPIDCRSDWQLRVSGPSNPGRRDLAPSSWVPDRRQEQPSAPPGLPAHQFSGRPSNLRA